MNKTEKEIMEELEKETAKLQGAIKTESKVSEVELPIAQALQEASKKVYAGIPEIGIEVGESGSGKATYVLVDYSCTSTGRTLWAYSGDKWRYVYLKDADLAGIAKVAMEADSLDAWWTDSQLTFVRCWKKF